MRTMEQKKSRECSYRVYHMEKTMYREGKLKRKYITDGMSRDEFKRKLMEDLKHERQ
jgi:hypothetical protein